jgi:hypothetical protein
MVMCNAEIKMKISADQNLAYTYIETRKEPALTGATFLAPASASLFAD